MRKHVHFPLKIDAEMIERVRKALSDSVELLKQNRPDTFLGRKSYEPFPREEEGTDGKNDLGSDSVTLPGEAADD